ncbi:6-carboxyhexanoate--CoA ligase [Desulfofundulus thermocisternus]|uniref:6-carboxyhexanoate--CoA ligase n=1 Tax=Desulfofundulus thermocisternus TaxID=42471 RepID=UPI001A0F5FBC|nr:6-carboxyhexanoate--CoA ligase [Desulfofundulus thermocisternus]MBE3585157.1 6-carboxyhexanoate--CoA ligase [Thermoanaerobacter sp.]MCS5696000.1 6-carboxyhexanoate--CoA ligase [Desulfofundulus thermocisternus]MDK2888274.1 6-carboxyhexanoate--CoA ligase [Thermoanaerobacter sp.]
MKNAVYSVRMRAAEGAAHEKGGRHISGAEKIVPFDQLAQTMQEMLHRAMNHPLGEPDFINIKVERLEPGQIRYIAALPLQTVKIKNHEQALLCARQLLTACGIQPTAIERALELLARGPAPGGQNMRGAVIMDAASGRRLEPDPWRGVRVSRMDYTPRAAAELSRLLEPLGLDHFRVREALALATKVIYAGTLAEICCSDDPHYTTGYVSSQRFGYVRIPHLKHASFKGGRVFFVRAREINLERYISRLQEEPVLIDQIKIICPQLNCCPPR